MATYYEKTPLLDVALLPAEKKAALDDLNRVKLALDDRTQTPNGEEAQKRTFLWIKGLFTGFLAVSSIVSLSLVLANPEAWTLNLGTTVDYRSVDTGALESDGYPPIVTGADSMIGLLNVGLVAAFVSVLATVSYAFGIWATWSGVETGQMSCGANPYVWASWWPWHFLTFLIVSAVAGIHNVYLFVLISLAVWGWIFLLWLDDLLQSTPYLKAFINNLISQYTSAKPDPNAVGTGRAQLMWNAVPTIFVFVLAITVYVVIIIYTSFTFSSDLFAAAGVKTGWLLAVVIVHLVAYLLNPIMFVVYKVGWISIHTREMFFYIFNGLFALISTWLTLVAFNQDGITPLIPA